MKKIVLMLYSMTFLSLSPAVAAMTSIDINKELKSMKGMNAFDGSAQNIKKAPVLAQVKIQQARRLFDSCQKTGLSLLAKSEVKEWLAITILQCAMASNDTNDTKNDTKKKNADLKKAVSVISSKLNLNVNGGVGPWKNSFTEIWTLVHAQLFNDTKSNAEKESLLETWSQYWGLLSKEQQSAWMDAKADVMVAQKKNAEAAFFLKQSHDLMPSKNLGDRIQNLLGLKPEITKTPNNLSPQPEQDLDDQIQKLSADGKMLEAQALMIESMKQFPQGKNARRYKDRALEIYFAQNKDHQDAALKNLLAADSSRQIEWAQSLHRRGDFKAALSLTEKILPQHLESPQAASLLWLAGRSAQFLGDYDKAIKYFDELVQKHSANDDALEAQFRLGLIQYRKENFLLAATYFDRVRNANRDRYELNAWYWMIRSFEKEKDARAVTERDLLISRYPFSYYGLRLRAEKQEGVISFPEVENETAEPVATLSLLPTQWAAWKRFKLLAENGWILEAQQELATLPQPVSSAALWKWMQLLSKAQQSLAVITLTNHLMDQDANFRRPSFMSLSFPKSYGQWIESEAKKYNLDPLLIRGLIRQESAYSLRAVSTSNAMGLMQMIPPTAEEIARKLKMKVHIPDDMYRPEINVPMGTFYVSDMLNQFSQNVPMALGAYNAGPVRLKSWLELRPEVAALKEKHSSDVLDELWFDELPWTETSFYIKAILRNVLIYQLIDKGPVTLKPVFWSDLAGPAKTAKTSQTPGSIVVK